MTDWRQKYGAQVAIDPLAPARWLDAVGTDVFKSLLEFHEEPVVSGELVRWTTTKVETGSGDSTFVLAAEQGGAVDLISDDASDDGINTQLGSASFKASATSYMYFGARFQVDEASAVQYFIGLSDPETNILGAPSSDLLGFRKAGGTANMLAVVRKTAVETTLTSILTQDADQPHTVEFEYNGPNHRVNFYVDGEATETRMVSFANIPTVLLLPSIHFRTQEGIVHTMRVQWMRTIQIGRS